MECRTWNGHAKDLSPGDAFELWSGLLHLWNDGFPGEVLENCQSVSKHAKELDVGSEHG